MVHDWPMTNDDITRPPTAVQDRTTPIWLSASASARRLGIDRGEMLALLHAGRIPAARSQGKHRPTWRVPVEELDRFAVAEAERQTAERLGEAS